MEEAEVADVLRPLGGDTQLPRRPFQTDLGATEGTATPTRLRGRLARPPCLGGLPLRRIGEALIELRPGSRTATPPLVAPHLLPLPLVLLGLP